MSRALAFVKIAGITALGVAIGCPAAGVGLGTAALNFAAGLSVEAAGQYLNAAFKKEKSGRDWLQNGHLSELICLTLASIIETELTTPASDRAAKRLKSLKPEHLALIAQDVPEVDTAVLPALYLKTPEQLRDESAGDVEDWKAILRFAFSDWDNKTLSCEIEEPELTQLATKIHRTYLNALLDVAVAHPEHSRKLVFKILSAGFATGEKTLEKVQELLNRQVPLFSRPEATNYGSEFDFNNELVTFRGRDAEIERIGKFLEGDGFKWWRLTGNGGAGKSRFALHLVDLARLEGWTSGFVGTLTEETYQDFAKWVPRHDTFLVFDYAVDHPALAKKFLNYLASNPGIKNSGKKVRALLLARESSPLRWQSIVSASTTDAALSNSLYTETVRPERGDPFNDPGTQVALADLTPDELLKVSEECWRGLGYAAAFPFEQAKTMIANLKGMSLANLPLYVQFATVALEKGVTRFAERHDIVEVVVKRQVDKWLGAGLSSAELDLAMYASIVGGVGVSEANQRAPDLFPATVDALNSAALNGMRRDFAEQPARDWIAPLSPDLIAEWYVLSRLRDERDELDTGAKERAERVWKVASEDPRFESFLFRVWNSFGELTHRTVIESDLSDEQRIYQHALSLEVLSESGETISSAQVSKFLAFGDHAMGEAKLICAQVCSNLLGRASCDAAPLLVWLRQSGLQLEYAQGLVNAIKPKLSTKEQAQEHIKELREIEGRSEIPEIQLCYAIGLFNAIKPELSTRGQAQEHIKALAEIEGRNENPDIQLQYANGLFNAIRSDLSTEEQAQEHIKALREIEGRNENPEIQLRYAQGLFNSIDPELSTPEQAQEHIKALREIEGRNENPEIQLQYANGLFNAIRSDLSTEEQAQEHIKALREIEGRNENPEIQLRYAQGLVNAMGGFPPLLPSSHDALVELCGANSDPAVAAVGFAGRLLRCLLTKMPRSEVVIEIRATFRDAGESGVAPTELMARLIQALHQEYQFTPDELPEFF